MSRFPTSASSERSADKRRTGSPPVAVVTGASAGVGRATAIAFALRGYRVALLARGHAGLDGARRDVEETGAEPLVCPVDVSDADEVFSAADRIVARWGRIDVWVNVAMETVVGPVDRIPPAEFKRVTEVTYLGVIHGTLAALHHMRPHDAGTIIQIGSALAYRAIPLQSAYCGAKFAIRGFTDSLRTELIHDRSRIRLTMVQLPGVNTPQFDWSHMHFAHRHQPVGTCYQPEAIARAVIRMAEADHAPRELWLGAPAIEAIVGAMLVPGLTDRYLAETAYEGQISDVPVRPGDPDTLLGPAARDHGARGRFSARARESVVAFNPLYVRGSLVLAGLGLLTGAFLLGRSRVTPSRPDDAEWRTPDGRDVRAVRPASAQLQAMQKGSPVSPYAASADRTRQSSPLKGRGSRAARPHRERSDAPY